MSYMLVAVCFFRRYNLAFKLVLLVCVVLTCLVQVIFLTYLNVNLLHCHHAMINENFFNTGFMCFSYKTNTKYLLLFRH